MRRLDWREEGKIWNETDKYEMYTLELKLQEFTDTLGKSRSDGKGYIIVPGIWLGQLIDGGFFFLL